MKVIPLNSAQYMCGKIKRWHTHFGLKQTVADHSWGVATIISLMHPNPSANLLKAALLHDAGEFFTGDVPSPAKQANPELKILLDKIERDAMTKMQIPVFSLTEEEQLWLKFADIYEAYCFLTHCHSPSLIMAVLDIQNLIEQQAEIAEKLGMEFVLDQNETHEGKTQ